MKSNIRKLRNERNISQTELGRVIGKTQQAVSHRVKEHGRRLFAMLLCVTMAVSGFPGSFFQAFASDVNEEYCYELERESLYEAVCTAVREGTTVDKELDITGKSADRYAGLFDADGTLYELKDLEVEKDADRDKVIDLRVFVRIEGEIPLDGYYEIDGGEPVIFLLTNKSKDETSVVICIDELETGKIDIIPASAVLKNTGPNSVDAATGAGSETALGDIAENSDGGMEDTAEINVEGETESDEAGSDEAEPYLDGSGEAETDDTGSDNAASVDAGSDETEINESESHETETDESETDDDDPEDADIEDVGGDSGAAESTVEEEPPEKPDVKPDRPEEADKTDKADDSDKSNEDHSDNNDPSVKDTGEDNSGSKADPDKADVHGKEDDPEKQNGSDNGSVSPEKTAAVSSNNIGLLAAAVYDTEIEETDDESEVTLASASDADLSDNGTGGLINGELYEAVLFDARKAAVAFVTTADDLGLNKYSSLEDQAIEAEIYETSSYGRKLDPDSAAAITLAGIMPVNARVKAYPVELIELERSEGVTVLAAYDISIYDAYGEKYQPQSGTIDVAIESDAISEALGCGYQPAVYHMEEGSEAEEIPSAVTENGTVEFEAQSFSVYAVAVNGGIQLLDSGTGSLEVFKYYDERREDMTYVGVWLEPGTYKMVYDLHNGTGDTSWHAEGWGGGTLSFEYGNVIYTAHYDGNNSNGSYNDWITFTIDEPGGYFIAQWDTYSSSGNERIYSFAAVDENATVKSSEVTYTYIYELTEEHIEQHFQSPLAGAEFILSYVSEDAYGESITYYAQFDESGMFTGWTQSREDAVTLVTDKDGLINVSGLPAGTYDLTETKAPEGYEILEESTVRITVSEDDNTFITIENDVIDEENPPTEAATAAVLVTKIWDDSENAAGQRPEEITVHLFANGTQIDRLIMSQNSETDKGDYPGDNSDDTDVDSDRWTYKFTGLDSGADYTVTEDLVDGYKTEIVTRTTDDEGSPLTDDEGNTLTEIIITNTYSTIDVDIYKYDDSAADESGSPSMEIPLSGAKFVVSRTVTEADEQTGSESEVTLYAVFRDSGDDSRILIIDKWTEEPDEATEIESSEDGYIHISLPAGEYTLTETKAPDGYIRITGDIKLTVNAGGGVTYNLGDGDITALPREGDTFNAPVIPVGNAPGVILPDTGGPGTLPFRAHGLILTGSAVWLLFLTLRRRRRWA